MQRYHKTKTKHKQTLVQYRVDSETKTRENIEDDKKIKKLTESDSDKQKCSCTTKKKHNLKILNCYKMIRKQSRKKTQAEPV